MYVGTHRYVHTSTVHYIDSAAVLVHGLPTAQYVHTYMYTIHHVYEYIQYIYHTQNVAQSQ